MRAARRPHERDGIDLGQQRDGQMILGDLGIEDEDAPTRKLAREERGWVLAEEIANIRRVRRVAGQGDEHSNFFRAYDRSRYAQESAAASACRQRSIRGISSYRKTSRLCLVILTLARHDGYCISMRAYARVEQRGCVMAEQDKQDRVQRCVCGNLRMAARLVTQRYDDALRPVGLRIMQFTLLARLHAAGAIIMTELAEAAALDRTTLTRNLKPLIERGYVRTVSGKDRRERLVALTDRGREALRE